MVQIMYVWPWIYQGRFEPFRPLNLLISEMTLQSGTLHTVTVLFFPVKPLYDKFVEADFKN